MFCTRGFTPITSKQARKVRTENEQNEYIKYLEDENARLNDQANEYRNKYIKKSTELQNFIETNKKISKLANQQNIILIFKNKKKIEKNAIKRRDWNCLLMKLKTRL